MFPTLSIIAAEPDLRRSRLNASLVIGKTVGQVSNKKTSCATEHGALAFVRAGVKIW